MRGKNLAGREATAHGGKMGGGVFGMRSVACEQGESEWCPEATARWWQVAGEDEGFQVGALSSDPIAQHSKHGIDVE